jgi:hypothetical protein
MAQNGFGSLFTVHGGVGANETKNSDFTQTPNSF